MKTAGRQYAEIKKTKLFHYNLQIIVEKFSELCYNEINIITEIDKRYTMMKNYNNLPKISAEMLLQESFVGMIAYRCSDSQILFSNRKIWDLFECKDEDEFMHFSGGSFFSLIDEDDRTGINTMYSQAKSNDIVKEHRVCYRVITSKGNTVEVEDCGSVCRLPDGTEIVSCTLTANRVDKVVVTERTDRLTGLLTKEQFYIYAGGILEGAEKNGSDEHYYVLYSNIRHFKYFNIRYGAETGNKVLAHLGKVLRLKAGQEVNARFGGDHFITLSNSRDIERIIESTGDYFEKRYGKVGIKLKIGVYEIKQKGISIEKACDYAKFACDSIKDDSTYVCFYDEKMAEALELEAYIIQNIDRVIRERHIQVVYQPVIRTINGSLCSLEALARWNDPRHGNILPEQFVPALEGNQLITKLDIYVLDEVCRNIRERQDMGYVNVPVSINFSRMDFLSCDLLSEVENSVRKYGIPRDMLYIEITEPTVMEDRNIFKREIKRFREAGYLVCMDNFGSGYSSLNVLREYDVDEIKLDTLFMHNFDEKTKQLVRSVLLMAKQLGIRTLAEGVSTQEQYDFLRETGCEKVQGYLFSQPVSSEKITEMYSGDSANIELRRWKKYYSKTGEVNFITDEPLALIDYDGSKFSYLYINQAYRDVWSALGLSGVDAALEIINSKASPIREQYLSLIDGLTENGDSGSTEMIINSRYARLSVKLIYQEQNRRLFSGELMLLSHDEDKSHTEEMDYICRMMYAMCDTVFVFNTAKNEIEILLPGTNFELLISDSDETDVIMKDISVVADKIIYIEDRDEFLRFMDNDTMLERIRKKERNYITEMFRTKTANGSYVWTLHTIQLIPGTETIIYSSRNVPNLYDSLMNRVRAAAASEEESLSVWNTLRQSRNVSVFWKDTSRRYVGVNAKFLETFGMKTELDVIGRTDEDMKWHIDDETFRDDDNAVLKEGKTISNSIGRCIIKGVVHNIITYKEPVYDNGRLIGLVGMILIAEELKDSTHERIMNENMDEVTGLMSAHGVAKTAGEYIERWEAGQEKFAVVTIVFESYKRAMQTYGSKAVKEILAALGKLISSECSSRFSVGRVHGGSFVLFAKYSSREEIEVIVNSVRSQCSKVHELGGYDVTLNPLVKAFYAEDARDVNDMMNEATNNYHIDYYLQKHHEQRHSSEILSRVPAAIAVFSISATYDIRRIYLSEQAKSCLHLAAADNSNLNELVSSVYPVDRSRVYNEFHRIAVDKTMGTIEFRCIGSDAQIYWNRLVLMPYMQDDGSYLLYGVYSDITDLKNRTEELKKQSQTDGLTGLKNRHALREDFDRLLPGNVTMIMMDIDHFKHFNDTFGHDLGDKVIVACAVQMRKHFADCDCYRYGGDEFLIVSKNLSPEESKKRMKEMIAETSSVYLGENIPAIEISYGMLNEKFSNKDELRVLFRKADTLLYERKKKRKMT